jgi:16S rRNA (adenine1518-N6/adenine1519-N6)-dimethyltransferase
MLAKKSLGQNFLTNTGIVASIADAALLSPNETVLEIGPGKGILTGELLKRGATVVAVEKDNALIPFLQEKFFKEISENKLVLVNDDILKFVIPAKAGIQGKHTTNMDSRLRGNDWLVNYKIVANIPYYITGQIIRKFLTAEKQPLKMVLLVQKEVAERIVAKNKKESLLSISVKAYGTPKLIKIVKAGSFTPAPKVDSAILLIDDISRDFFKPPRRHTGPRAGIHTVQNNVDPVSRHGMTNKNKNNTLSEERFFEILHAGFAHKRKQLFGNLRAVFDEKLLREKMKEAGISENIRAEDVSLFGWKKLSEQ